MSGFRLLALNLALGLFCIAAVALLYFDPGRAKALTREDGPIEWSTVACYAAASGFMIGAALRARHRSLFLWGYALLFFLVAGEEISWGQRLLGFETPRELKEINVQREFTIHNVKGLFNNVRMIGLLVIGVIAFGIPLVHKISPLFRALSGRIAMPVFPWWAGAIVAAGALFMAIPRLKYTYGVQTLDEVGEFLLSVAMCVFAAAVFYEGRLPIESGSPGGPTGHTVTGPL